MENLSQLVTQEDYLGLQVLRVTHHCYGLALNTLRLLDEARSEIALEPIPGHLLKSKGVCDEMSLHGFHAVTLGGECSVSRIDPWTGVLNVPPIGSSRSGLRAYTLASVRNRTAYGAD
jgi:hypothetical protein